MPTILCGFCSEPHLCEMCGEKKLTFEEWWEKEGVFLNHKELAQGCIGPFIDKSTFKRIWEAAQENM